MHQDLWLLSRQVSKRKSASGAQKKRKNKIERVQFTSVDYLYDVKPLQFSISWIQASFVVMNPISLQL